MYKRPEYHTVIERLRSQRKFLQVVMGPRQVGKTTLMKQVLNAFNGEIPFLSFTADNVPATQSSWITDCWATARAQIKMGGYKEFILVIDEIQKLKGWSEVVKKEWDDDTNNDINLKVILLGSSRIMIQKGLADSLAGRFETIKMSHWGYTEMQEAFGLTLDEYMYYGGYPGSASLIEDSDRWSQYIKDSIIDATINKDIILETVISKPALLRQTFELGAAYSGQMISLTKFMGSLQDAGNTTTLSGYLNALTDSGLLTGIQKFSFDTARRRASIPKFQVFNSALRSVYSGYTFKEAFMNPKVWGRFFESAIGAHIVSSAFAGSYEVFYWRDGNSEVDYIIKKNNKTVAIEVKSNHSAINRGLADLRQRQNLHNSLVVGPGGMDAGLFLSTNPAKLFE